MDTPELFVTRKKFTMDTLVQVMPNGQPALISEIDLEVTDSRGGRGSVKVYAPGYNRSLNFDPYHLYPMSIGGISAKQYCQEFSLRLFQRANDAHRDTFERTIVYEDAMHIIIRVNRIDGKDTDKMYWRASSY